MADLSEFLKLAKPAHPICRIGLALEKLEKKEAEQLLAALATDRGIINAGAIRDWLGQRGHLMPHAIVTAHRMGQCSCHHDA